jgi:Transcription termination factor nusG
MHPFWSACRLQPQRDRLALHFLAQAGFETYAPRVHSERLFRGRAIESQPRLLFGTYVFMLIVTQWHAVNCTPGVVRLV